MSINIPTIDDAPVRFSEPVDGVHESGVPAILYEAAQDDSSPAIAAVAGAEVIWDLSQIPKELTRFSSSYNWVTIKNCR